MKRIAPPSPAGLRSQRPHRRRGAGSLDYVLVLGAVLPMVGATIYFSKKIIGLAYEMMCLIISCPFM